MKKFIYTFFLATLLTNGVFGQQNPHFPVKKSPLDQRPKYRDVRMEQQMKKARVASLDSVYLPEDVLHFDWDDQTDTWLNPDSIHLTYDLVSGAVETETAYDVFGTPLYKYVYSGPFYPFTNEYTNVTSLYWEPSSNDWMPYDKQQNFYDSRGNYAGYIYMIYNEVSKTWQMDMQEVVDNVYDSNDRLIESIHYWGMAGQEPNLSGKRIFYYDDAGRCTQYVLEGRGSGAVWQNQLRTLFVYNQQGVLVEVEDQKFNTDNQTWVGDLKYTEIGWHDYYPEHNDGIYWDYFGDVKQYRQLEWQPISNTYRDKSRFSKTYIDGYGSHVDSVETADQGNLALSSVYTVLFDERLDQVFSQTEGYVPLPYRWSVIDSTHSDRIYNDEGAMTQWSYVYTFYGSVNFPYPYEYGNKYQYKNFLKLYFTTGTPASVNTNEITVYPNPTQAASQLKLKLNNPSAVHIELFNVIGQYVQTVAANTKMNTGEYVFDLNLPEAGIYFVRTTVNGETITRKLVCVK